MLPWQSYFSKHYSVLKKGSSSRVLGTAECLGKVILLTCVLLKGCNQDKVLFLQVHPVLHSPWNPATLHLKLAKIK